MMTLLRKAATERRLRYAWEKIRHRPESKGIDEQTIRDFESRLNKNLKEIRKDLIAKNYKFTPLRGLLLKQGVKDRPLRIPAVRDRVVQKAIELTIFDYLKKKYQIVNPVSFAYIKDRSVKDAALRVRDLYRAGNKWVYEADIKKFFDSVDRSKLLKEFIFPALPDDTINDLITAALNAELGNSEELQRMGKLEKFPLGSEGIPQGGILSPLFANVYLSPLDAAMTKGGFQMVRYADDFVVMCKTKDEAKAADALAREVVESGLDLKIYPLEPAADEKKRSRVCTLHNVEFLGLVFQGEKILPSGKAMAKMVATIKGIPEEYKDDDLSSALYAVRSRVLTWGATYFYTDVSDKIRKETDKHLVAAIRAMLNGFGLSPNGKVFDEAKMAKLGVPSFSQAIDRAKLRDEKKRKRRI